MFDLRYPLWQVIIDLRVSVMSVAMNTLGLGLLTMNFDLICEQSFL